MGGLHFYGKKCNLTIRGNADGKGIRYTDEFKQEAVNQVVIHGYPVYEVSQRLSISTKSLYVWIKKFSKPRQQRENESDLQAENARLKRELKRAQ